MSYNPSNPNGQATATNSAPVVLASNQTPFPTTSNNVSLTGSQSATISTSGMNTVLLNISGTWTGLFNFEQSVDGVNFFPISAVDIVGLGNQAPVSASANGTWAFNVSGSTVFKLLNNSSITGTAVVQLGASPQQSVNYANLATEFVSQTGTWSMRLQDGSGNAIASTSGALDTIAPNLYVTGQSAQTALVNNILTATSGTAATDVLNYDSATVQVTSTGTGGAFIFEGSNDNVNFQAIPVFNQLILTGTPITSAITASASQLIYTFPVAMRYIRLRISTAITGGSIQAFSKFAVQSFTPSILQVAQTTAANLATTATIASGTVTTVSTVTALSAINSVATTNGLSLGTNITAATPATISAKATAGRLHFLHCGNPNATAVYLKIFNVAAPTLGTTAANMNFLIPATSSITLAIGDQGLFFSTAIVFAVTGGQSLTDNTSITTGANLNYSYI